MAPPPIINNIQNPDNIPNEPNQNLLDNDLINQPLLQKRLKTQKYLSVNIFIFSSLNLFFSLFYTDIDRVKEKRKKMAINFLIFFT